METFSALLAICAGNSPAPGEFPTQRPVTPSFDLFFDLRPNKRLSKQSWGCWFETPSCPFWCHCNGNKIVASLQVTFKMQFLVRKNTIGKIIFWCSCVCHIIIAEVSILMALSHLANQHQLIIREVCFAGNAHQPSICTKYILLSYFSVTVSWISDTRAPYTNRDLFES